MTITDTAHERMPEAGSMSRHFGTADSRRSRKGRKSRTLRIGPLEHAHAATTPDVDPSAQRMNPTEISPEAESIRARDSAQGYAGRKNRSESADVCACRARRRGQIRMTLAQAVQFFGTIFRQQCKQCCRSFCVDLSGEMCGHEVTLEREQQIAGATIERAAGLVAIAVRGQCFLQQQYRRRVRVEMRAVVI